MNTYQRYAEKKAGTHNKFYAVEAEELESGRANWTFRWGRIGSEGQTKEGESYSYEGAVSICDAQFVKKCSRGYTEVNAMQALASAVEEIHERKTNGLSKVEIVFPNFFAGKSEGRCHQFCQKWVGKLNVVRGSKFDLGDTAYQKQIKDVLKGFCKEWGRIVKTQAHGHLEDNANAWTAFRIVFAALKDDAGTRVCGHFEGVGTSY